MKAFFITTALVEIAAGLGFVLTPHTAVTFLLGNSPESPAFSAICRIAGAALIALGVACWKARSETRSATSNGLVTAMLVYNSATVVLLAYSGLTQPVGIALWPGVILHTVMDAWCILSLRAKKT